MQHDHFTKNAKKNLSQALDTVYANRCNSADAFGYWTNAKGTLAVAADGYQALSAAAKDLRTVGTWRTYPLEHLKQIIAHALIASEGDSISAVSAIESALSSGIGRQRAYLGFWHVHLKDGVTLDFGEYTLRHLGDEGFEREILAPLRIIRSGKADSEEDEEHVERQCGYLRNVPSVTVEYVGAAEGAVEIVAPIGDHISEFLQFITAPKWQSRSEVKPIEHRGLHYGRFATSMPVVSGESDRLSLPNLMGNPWGTTIDKNDIDVLRGGGILDLMPHIPKGPGTGKSVIDMLLRAIQLFSDGERAMSNRQAIVSYVGACEALFGHRKFAERYTCTGIALVLGGDFETQYKYAKELYEKRSRAAHQGLTPISSEDARLVAHRVIRHIAADMKRFTSKKAIRAWIEPYAERHASEERDG